MKKADRQKYAILFVHGFEGDFYSQPYIPVISDAFKDNGCSFLSGETRGTGLQTRFQKTDGKEYICGSHLELLKESYMDIDAWIDLLIEKGYKNVMLIGPSLGSQKIIRYMAEGNHIKYVKKIVIMAPSDTHGFADILSQGKYKNIIQEAKNKINEGKGREFIKQDMFDINMSYQTFASWFTNDHFGKMFNFGDKDNNYMLLHKITVPVF